MAPSPEQIFPGCGHLTVEPAALPQTHSQFLVPSPVSLTLGHGPFLDILVAKPWPEIGVPSPSHILPLPSPLDPTKAPSISLRPLLTRPLFQCLLTPEYWSSEVPSTWTCPMRVQAGETVRLLPRLVCLLTALHPSGSKSV